MTMKHQMPEFMSSIVAAMLGRLHRIEEDEWYLSPPEGVSIDFSVVLTERKHPNAVRFQKVNHILDVALTNAPFSAQCHCRCFGFEVPKVG